MRLWPSKKQWIGWSLPSKLGFIGSCASVIGLLIAVVIWAFSPESATREGQIADLAEHEETQRAVKDLSAAIRELSELEQGKRSDVRGLELPEAFDRAKLDARYPLGWAFFYGYGDRVVASRQSFETVEVLAWPNMRIDSHGEALFTGEHYVHRATRNQIINHGEIVIDRIGRARPFQIDDTCFWYELIRVEGNRGLGLVGFSPSEHIQSGGRICP